MKRKIKTSFALAVSLITALYSFAQERTLAENQDKELGKVSWYRDYDDAVTESL